jgi:hypothetical protein
MHYCALMSATCPAHRLIPYLIILSTSGEYYNSPSYLLRRLFGSPGFTYPQQHPAIGNTGRKSVNWTQERGQGLMVGFCEGGNEPYGSIKI